MLLEFMHSPSHPVLVTWGQRGEYTNKSLNKHLHLKLLSWWGIRIVHSEVQGRKLDGGREMVVSPTQDSLRQQRYSCFLDQNRYDYS